jgi:serine O-acetyltransferase
MVTFKQTINNIKADFARRLLLEQAQNCFFKKLCILFMPSTIGVLVYRLSRYCVHNRLSVVYRLLTVVEHYYARNEISPYADIGHGLVIEGVGVGVPSCTKIGKNCTLFGRNTISLGAMEGVDLLVDTITLGDYCVLGQGVKIMRPVTLGHAVQILPNSVVMFSEQIDGVILSGVPARNKGQIQLEQMSNWNPLKSQLLRLESI